MTTRPPPGRSSAPPDGTRLTGELPAHVAIIMDGNGRWARERGRTREFGHRAGMIAARRTIEAALHAGVGTLTLYAFSEENWQRPYREVAALLTAFELSLRGDLRETLARRGVAVRVLGDLRRLASRQREAIRGIVANRPAVPRLQLNLAVSYGGRAEIVRAARRLADRVERGTLTAGEIDEGLLAANLYTADLPDPDLLVRTSGEHRVSNFLLWQIAYSELHFSPVLWPDYTQRHFYEAIRDYQRRDRRFGRAPHAAAP